MEGKICGLVATDVPLKIGARSHQNLKIPLSGNSRRACFSGVWQPRNMMFGEWSGGGSMAEAEPQAEPQRSVHLEQRAVSPFSENVE